MAKLDLTKLVKVSTIAATAATAIVQSPATAATPDDKPVIEQKIEEQTKKELAKAEDHVNAILRNATNQEPWYKSMVITGTLVAIIIQVFQLFGREIAPEMVGPLTQLVSNILTLVAIVWALVGRLRTGKPLFE